MWIPVLIFGLLLAGAVLLAALPGRWRVYGAPTAVGIPILCLLLWLSLRGQLPLAAAHTAVTLPTLVWQLDAISWPVTLWLFLLLIALITRHLNTITPEQINTFSPFLIVTAFALPVIWAGSPTTMMVSWAALLTAWGTAVWLNERGREGQRQHTFVVGDSSPANGTEVPTPNGFHSSSWVNTHKVFWQMGLLLTAVLLLWFGAAAVDTPGWDAAAWPQTALLAVLLAALLPLSVWPLRGWRASVGTPPAVALVLTLWPVAAGGMLLVRLVDGTSLTVWSGGMLLTLAGLFGLLQAVRQLWERLHLPGTAVFFLAAALVHLLLLAAVWGNQITASPDGVLAMLRVLLLAGGIFYLVAGRPASRRLWWRAIPPLAALAAIAGLPLTAGLAGQVALMEGLEGHGRYLALLVVVLLEIPLLTAGLRLFWPVAGGDDVLPGTLAEWAVEAVIFLPMLGLISVSGVVWGAVSWFTWLLLLVVPVGSVILLRFVPELNRTVAAVRQAFTFRLPVNTAPLRQWLRGMSGAFEEAAAILEGDGSLIWLLILIVVLLLAQ